MELKEWLRAISGMCRSKDFCIGCAAKDKTGFCPLVKIPEDWSEDDVNRVVAATENWIAKHE